jgi:hypothetical protein
MRTRKIQAKIEPELEDYVKRQKDFKGMSNYVRKALIQRSKYTPKQKV